MKTKNLITKLVIDTEILLIYYKNEKDSDKIEKLFDKIDAREIEGIISVMTLSEMYYIVARIDINKAEEIFYDMVNSNLRVVEIGEEIAKLAGRYKHKYSKAKGSLPIADAVIAATSRIEDAPLLAIDPHFSRIKEIDLVNIDYMYKILT